MNGISPEAVIQSTIGYLTCINRIDSFRGMELLGHVVLKHVLQREENSGEQDGASMLPFIFTAYSLVQDLIFHGYGPNYTFVAEVLQSITNCIITRQKARDRLSNSNSLNNLISAGGAPHPLPSPPGGARDTRTKKSLSTQTPRTVQTSSGFHSHGSEIEEICARYTHEDIAAIFLAYSFVVNRTLRPLVPFPRNSGGFPAFIFSEAKMLFPRLFQVIGFSM